VCVCTLLVLPGQSMSPPLPPEPTADWVDTHPRQGYSPLRRSPTQQLGLSPSDSLTASPGHSAVIPPAASDSDIAPTMIIPPLVTTASGSRGSGTSLFIPKERTQPLVKRPNSSTAATAASTAVSAGSVAAQNLYMPGADGYAPPPVISSDAPPLPRPAVTMSSVEALSQMIPLGRRAHPRTS